MTRWEYNRQAAINRIERANNRPIPKLRWEIWFAKKRLLLEQDRAASTTATVCEVVNDAAGAEYAAWADRERLQPIRDEITGLEAKLSVLCAR